MTESKNKALPEKDKVVPENDKGGIEVIIRLVEFIVGLFKP